jgi:hypothetical protein
MADSADRDDELVAHTAPECTRLCKGEMMRIRRHAAAHEARLSQHEFPVILSRRRTVFPKARIASLRDCFLVARWRVAASDALRTHIRYPNRLLKKGHLPLTFNCESDSYANEWMAGGIDARIGYADG